MDADGRQEGLDGDNWDADWDEHWNVQERFDEDGNESGIEIVQRLRLFSNEMSLQVLHKSVGVKPRDFGEGYDNRRIVGCSVVSMELVSVWIYTIVMCFTKWETPGSSYEKLYGDTFGRVASFSVEQIVGNLRLFVV